jgi:hypothetical protein
MTMNHFCQKTITILLVALFALAGCQNPLNQPENVSGKNDAGNVTISIGEGAGGAARTLSPSDADLSGLTYQLSFSGSGGASHAAETVTFGTPKTVSLAPGNWTITAQAESGSTVKAEGSWTGEVSAGDTTEVSLTLLPKTGSGNGTLAYTVSFPDLGAGGSKSLTLYTVTESSETAVGTPVTDFSSGTPATKSLPAGFYRLSLRLTDSAGKIAARTDAVHIYAGLNTTAAFDFAVADFRILSSIAVKTPPTKITYAIDEDLNLAGLVITATYSDSSTADISDTTKFITSGFNSSAAAANQTVTVSYTEGSVTKETTFTVTISAGSGNTDPKTLVITDIEETLVTQFQDSAIIGIFPVGTTLEQALSWTGIIAGAATDDEALSTGPAPYTVTVELLDLEDGTSDGSRWTGSGTYDIYLLTDSEDIYGCYRKENVSFTSASTSVSIADFSTVISPGGSSDYDGGWNGSDGSYFVISGSNYEFHWEDTYSSETERGLYTVSGSTITFFWRSGHFSGGGGSVPDGQFTIIKKEDWTNTGTLADDRGSFTMQVTVTTTQYQDGQKVSQSGPSSETVTFTMTTDVVKTITVGYDGGNITLKDAEGTPINGFTLSKTGTPSSVILSADGAFTGITWYVDGESKDTSASLTLNAANYAAKTHSVTFTGWRNGSYLSSSPIPFTVFN